MTEIWPRILRSLEGRLDTKELKTWFAPTRQVSFAEGSEGPTLTIGVPNRVFADWIEGRHGALLSQEAAVLAMMRAGGGRGVYNIDEFRHGIERMNPSDYLRATYYE